MLPETSDEMKNELLQFFPAIAVNAFLVFVYIYSCARASTNSPNILKINFHYA